MTLPRAALLVSLAGAVLFCLPAPLRGQTLASAVCPDSGIAILSVDSLLGRVAQRPLRSSVDTTYDLAIARKHWSVQSVSVRSAAGIVGTERASWAACAGAWVRIDRAEVSVERVEGRVHLRASLEPLVDVLRRHSSQTQSSPGREDR
jgi:hypothetical protein